MRPNHRVMSTPPPPPASSGTHRRRRGVYSDEEEESPTPICRCRVLYLGSSVPCVTKDGLQGIQEPLKELYPDDEENQSTKGIDSWLSVWSNGFLLENIDENRKKVTRFFPIESLHYCAAVRYVLVPGSGDESKARFLPLDSPFAKNPYNNHPPLFAAILRRTSGIKVLECHVFICKKETAANALVRCSFHSYADSTYAKNLENGASLYGTLGNGPPLMSSPNPMSANGDPHREYQQSVIEVSEDSINSIEKVEEWKVISNGTGSNSNYAPSMQHQHHIHQHPHSGTQSPNPKKSPMNQNGKHGNPDEISVYNGDDNHKIWAGKNSPSPGDQSGDIYDYGSTLRSYRSTTSGVSRKPRQMVMPSSPPPPPIREEESPSKDAVDGTMKKDKKKKKPPTHRSKSRENTLKRPTDSQSVILNGGGGRSSTLNGHTSRKISSTGSLVGTRHFLPPPQPPPPPHHHHHHGGGPPPPPPPPPMLMTLRPPAGKKAGTFSSRSKSRPPFVMYGPPPPPHMMLPPHPHMMPPRHVLEEPIYMPHNARPLSPVASYQPGHFPHEAYYANQQQYATIDKAHKHRGKSRRNVGGNDEEASEFGLSGIHRKGQHINERAFSHSIRNEHRSRSYGSLANMSIHDHEKEMMRQMVAGMKLNGDHIERSEVPPGLYHPRGGDIPPHHIMQHHETIGTSGKGKNKKKR